jgi:glycosyltransferase involved in cell wall biosynthesis
MNQKKTIAFVGSVGIPARYGGFETLVEQLTILLSSKYNITVYCSSRGIKKPVRKKTFHNAKLSYINLNANGFQSILYDIISIFRATSCAKTIIILGGSAAWSIGLFSFFFPKIKFIFHPDGAEWNRKKWNNLSKKYLHWSVMAGCRAANKIIIDNEALLNFYQPFKDKLINASYGGNQYKVKKANTSDFWLTIARSEPENNLDLIAECFNNIHYEKWIILSNFSKTKYGRKFKKKYHQSKNIELIDSNYDKHVLNKLLSECKGYIHGHSAGGTNPTLVAAMWINKPLICHKNIYNIATTRKQSMFFSTTNELIEIVSLQKDDLIEKNLSAYKLAKEKYTWKAVADVYDSIL